LKYIIIPDLTSASTNHSTGMTDTEYQISTSKFASSIHNIRSSQCRFIIRRYKTRVGGI